MEVKDEADAADAVPTTSTTSSVPQAEKSTAAPDMLVKLSTNGVPKLFCPMCNKALVSLNGYVKHLKKHEPPGGFCCRYCDERFCYEEELKKHNESVHTTIACRMCSGITFVSEDEYREHIKLVHQGLDREVYSCDKCPAVYKTLEPFKRHKETECGTIKPFKCDQCSMAFVTKYILKQHMEVHSEILKFCCSYCGKNFKQKARLVEHERTHTGEKPYKCDVCEKAFSHRESLVTHSTLHTGVRLIECRCCSSKFSCYSNLIKHRRNRPETCGQPEFDPPKTRVRKFTSRIPALLNPTSEIRLVKSNKIIKPDDKEKADKVLALKKELSPEKPAKKKGDAATPRAKPGPKPGSKRKYTKKKKIKIEEDEGLAGGGAFSSSDEEVIKKISKVEPKIRPKRSIKKINYDNESEQPLQSSAVNNLQEDNNGTTTTTTTTTITVMPIMPSTATLTNQSTKWSDDSDDNGDNFPDFEPDSENDAEDNAGFKEPMDAVNLANIKMEKDDSLDDEENYEELDEFEYTPIVKLEEGEDTHLFNDKDKILDCLLNDNEFAEIEDVEVPMEETFKKKTKRSGDKTKADRQQHQDILEETELVLIKDENSHDKSDEEYDILDINRTPANADITKCFVELEDVSSRYPQIKEGESTIKVSNNVKPFFKSSSTTSGKSGTKRERRKRGPYLKRVKKETIKIEGDEEADGGDSAEKPASDDADGNGDNTNKKRRRKRLAKLTGEELKKRIQLARKRDRSWQCPECIKIYFMRKPYEKHLREDHKKTEEQLKEIFKDEYVEELIGDDAFKCHICGKLYLMEKRLIDHIPKHGPEGNLIHKCPCYCVLYFATVEDAVAHAHEAHKELLWCELCEKFMQGIDTLKWHKVRVHGEKGKKIERNLICDKCGKKFMGRTQLTDHVRSDCGRIPIYQCNICGKSLTTAGILKTHLITHQDEKPYQCDKCGKQFKIKSQYKTHIKFSHSDEKRFKCHLCPKEYPYRESLLTHMSVHTGIKRFMCNGCGKRFTCVSNLQAHRKVQADSCGLLPLNAKATQYMGVQKGNLLMGAKPEPGLDYVESQTMLAKEIFTEDVPMAHELHFNTNRNIVLGSDSGENVEITGGVPLNYATNNMLLL